MKLQRGVGQLLMNRPERNVSGACSSSSPIGGCTAKQGREVRKLQREAGKS
jgi:hypothetical protein